jgi:CHAD domain-containing protein
MAYRLKLAKAPTATARRTLLARLDKACARLRDEPDAASALHDARTDLKKARALLRLLRPGLARARYDAEMATLRGCARGLSATRDTDVLPVTLTQLREHFGARLPETEYAVLSGRLRRQSTVDEDRTALQAQLEPLEAARARLATEPLGSLRWSDLLDMLEATYRRGRDACLRAEHDATVETLHEWRKRTKDLLYQLRLFEEAWPEVVDVYVRQAARVSDLLGEDHDLAVLAAALRDLQSSGESELPSLESVIELAEERRGELHAEACVLGQRLFAETPKAFRKRTARLVEVVSRQSRREAFPAAHVA